MKQTKNCPNTLTPGETTFKAKTHPSVSEDLYIACNGQAIMKLLIHYMVEGLWRRDHHTCRSLLDIPFQNYGH